MNGNKKFKIEGVNSKEITAFLIMIGVIIILLFFELFLFEGRTDVRDDNIKIEKKLQEMSEVTVKAEEKTVYHELNNIISMMNNKDYDGLYSKLKDDYKEYYFNDLETFKGFMDKYAAKKYYPKYTSYYRDGDLYYIMIEFLQEEYTREDLLSERTVKVDTIVLEEVEKNTFKFAMNGFVENIIHNTSKTVDGVTFTLQNSVRNIETMKTNLMIKNNSDRSVSINSSDIYPDIYGSITSKVSVNSSLYLDPGEVGVLSIEYYFQYNSNREFKGVVINEILFTGGKGIENIKLSI